MNWFYIMALVGVAAKVWAFWRLNQYSTRGSLEYIVFFCLVAIATLHTGFEVFNYSLLGVPESAWVDVAMDGYYICAVATMVILPFALTLAMGRPVITLLPIAFAGFFAFMVYAILATDYIVAGYVPLEYNYTRVAGEGYWLFQGFIVTSLVFSVVTLIKGVKSSDYFVVIKASNLLIGLTVLFLIVTLVIAGMAFGMNVSAAGVVPLAMAFFIAFAVANLKPEAIRNWRNVLPWTEDYRIRRTILKDLDFIRQQGPGLASIRNEQRQAYIDLAVLLYNGNQYEAAKWLDCVQSTISKHQSPESKQRFYK